MRLVLTLLAATLFLSACALANETNQGDRSVESVNYAQFSESTSDSHSIVRTRQALMVDPWLGMRSGCESLLGLHYGLAWAEDQLLGTHWFDEQSVLGKASGIADRLAKTIFLDTPVDYFTVILAHEYWGHGARYRELSIHPIDYGFDWPPPYGVGGGFASANIKNGLVSDHEELAIWMGGLEIHTLMNRKLGMDWISKREIHYREASLYFWSWQIMFNYIQSASDNSAEDIPDNDPRAYVRILNRHAGYPNADNLRFTVKDLQARNNISLLNPFVFFALYAQIKTYAYDGNTMTKLPMIHLGKIDYLPLLRMGLSPFGPEYHLENYIRTLKRAALIDLRLGDRTFRKGWGGIGMQVRSAYERGRISLDLNLDLWKQPKLELGGMDGKLRGGDLGIATSARGYYKMTHGDFPVMGLLELGFKSPGFLEGYALDAAPIAMIGIAVQK